KPSQVVNTRTGTHALTFHESGTSQVACDPEPHPSAPRIGRGAHAERRTILVRRAAPGTTTDHPLVAPRVHPRAAVGRRAHVVFMPAILDPFRNVAVDVVQAERIGLETHHRRRPPIVVVVVLESVG